MNIHDPIPAKDIARREGVSAPVTTSRHSLFRPESIEARQLVWLGRPAVKLGLPAALMSAAAVLLVAAAAALVTFGSYARRIEIHGVILPAAGLIQVSSPVAGWIQSMHAHEGQTVTSGVLLYVVNTDIANSKGGTQQQILQSLGNMRSILMQQIADKIRLRNEQDAELRLKVENLQSQVRQLDAEILMKDEFLATITKTYVDFTHYQQRGISTIHEKLAAQQNWMHAKADFEELKNEALHLRAQLNESQYQLETNDLQVDNEIDGMRERIAEIDQRVVNSETQHSIDIVAPEAGTVTAVAAQPGQMIANGASMLTIIPGKSSMRAELIAPSTAIAFIHPGQRVLLRYSAFPYQRFGQYWGTVTEVSHAALLPEELKTLVPSLLPTEQSKTFYRVVVVPDRQSVRVNGHPAPLEASMQVDASVVLDRRPLYQWLLQPLYDFRRT
jgi:membrane fusion protein